MVKKMRNCKFYVTCLQRNSDKTIQKHINGAGKEVEKEEEGGRGKL